MKNECSIVRDLIPLYAENLTGEETSEFVREHIEGCKECKKELTQALKPADVIADINTKPMKKLKKELAVKKIQLVALTAIIVLSISVSVFSFLTAPIYLPYSEENVFVTENENGSITVVFPEEAANYRCTMTEYDGFTEYSVESWTSIIEKKIPCFGVKAVTVNPKPGEATVIRYVQNNGQEDILLYSDSQHETGGVITLPRLVLNYYIVMAVVSVIVLLITYMILRKKEKARLWLGRLMLIPISYIAGNLMVTGAGGITYSVQRDFALISIVSILVYCALLIIGSVLRQRKESVK